MDDRARRNVSILLTLCAVVVFAALLSAGAGLYQRFQETNVRRSAQARYNATNLATWNKVLCLIERGAQEDPKTTKAEKAAGAAYINSLLRSIHAGSCARPKRPA